MIVFAVLSKSALGKNRKPLILSTSDDEGRKVEERKEGRKEGREEGMGERESTVASFFRFFAESRKFTHSRGRFCKCHCFPAYARIMNTCICRPTFQPGAENEGKQKC